jgi:hypothetical protein
MGDLERTVNLYDLLDDDLDPAAVLAGLSARDRRALEASWEFWARPGQAWAPGREFITNYECGRGAGKTRTASEAIVAAATDPERWGGEAIIVGVNPTQVKRDCLFGQSGVFPAAERSARNGLGPAIVDRNLVDRWLRFEAPRGGGGAGLTVYWASSYHPASVHGVNVGLVWGDEYGQWYHDRKDSQGNNAWNALLPAVRVGRPTSHIILTQTPSSIPQVRAIQRDAERPPCLTCRDRMLQDLGGPWRGEEGREPWRLPTSPQRVVHPLLETRSTEVVRTCPRCGGEVVAEVRTVFGATMDNATLEAKARSRALAELASGEAWARRKYAPRGEVDAASEHALLKEEHVRRVYVAERPLGRPGGQVRDRWQDALDDLGDVAEVVVFVDPAVTANATSDETGVVAAASRRNAVIRTLRGGPNAADAMRHPQSPDVGGDIVAQVVGLEDASVSPRDVLAAGGGAPSAVWGPKAYWTALLWGATRIVVEVNQGGEEVTSGLRELCRRPPPVADIMRELRERFAEFAGVTDARMGVLANRVAATARALKVEAVRRRSDKPTRFQWYGESASMGRQALLDAWWLGGGAHWQVALGQGTGYEPVPGSGHAAVNKKDRWDAMVAAAQVLLGVRETHRGEVEETPGGGWMGRVGASALQG